MESSLVNSLSYFPVVLLSGARQVGKSTLVQATSNKSWPALKSAEKHSASAGASVCFFTVVVRPLPLTNAHSLYPLACFSEARAKNSSLVAKALVQFHGSALNL